jgi:hypothetical protein
MHSNFATMETDLSLGPAPAVADAASATIMRRAMGQYEIYDIGNNAILAGTGPWVLPPGARSRFILNQRAVVRRSEFAL